MLTKFYDFYILEKHIFRLIFFFFYFQVQERLSKQIAEAVTKAIDPNGVAVIIEGVLVYFSSDF